MRARQPDREGYVERGGVRTFYEIHGNGAPTVLFLPAWAICHSRIWKAQVPYFARHYRVVTFDPRGNGRSDRPLSSSAYLDTEYVQDALAVMDATQTERAVMVGLSTGGWLAALLAARYPNRVFAAVMAGSRSPLSQPLPERTVYSFEDRLETEGGWAKHNRHYWRKDYRGYLEFFFSQAFPEPHSTRRIEEGVAWGLETTPDVLAATLGGRGLLAEFTEDPEQAVALYQSIQCPLLVIHGEQDKIVSHDHGAAIAEATGAPFVTIAGGGHNSFGRDPVKLNLMLRAFIDRVCRLSNAQSSAFTL